MALMNIQSTTSTHREQLSPVSVTPRIAHLNTLQEEFSYISDEEDEETFVNKQNTSTSRIEKLINERYNRVTSLILDDEGWPVRYCYYSEGEIPSYEEHVSITYNRFARHLIDDRVRSEWLKLRHEEQDKLYMFLYAGISIWKRVYFDWRDEEEQDGTSRDGGQWFRRSRPFRQNEIYSKLRVYGLESLELEKNVLEVLARGRTKAEMESCIKDISKKSISNQSLEDAWERALINGMDNSPAQHAVLMLLDAVIGLLPGLCAEAPFPYVTVLNEASSATGDAVSITSCSSSVSETGSKCTPPPAKRTRTSENSEEATESQPKKAEHNNVTWPKKNHKFVDLKVACIDEMTSAAKYLIIIKIDSKGKHTSQSQKEFIKELVHVLQSQCEVFGLFVSTERITLYHVSRAPDSKIVLKETVYVMVEENLKGVFSFSVAKFQKLVMDILSCILYGIRYIDV